MLASRGNICHEHRAQQDYARRLGDHNCHVKHDIARGIDEDPPPRIVANEETARWAAQC